MTNRLLLRDRRNDLWGNVNARIFWEGGGQDGVWVNSSGTGEFSGSGVVLYVDVAGEKIYVVQKVAGNSTIVAVSQNTH
ncbi:MAG: hypothetical protein K1X65_13545 [Caldilineales bacterium]|nr:hypothetical protein [Caldilineales bacterium]